MLHMVGAISVADPETSEDSAKKPNISRRVRWPSFIAIFANQGGMLLAPPPGIHYFRDVQ